jgi:hypothetical protein
MPDNLIAECAFLRPSKLVFSDALPLLICVGASGAALSNPFSVPDSVKGVAAAAVRFLLALNFVLS